MVWFLLFTWSLRLCFLWNILSVIFVFSLDRLQSGFWQKTMCHVTQKCQGIKMIFHAKSISCTFCAQGLFQVATNWLGRINLLDVCLQRKNRKTLVPLHEAESHETGLRSMDLARGRRKLRNNCNGINSRIWRCPPVSSVTDKLIRDAVK